MRRFITVWSLCCAILFAWSISGQAAIIFDNSSRGDAQSNREAENSSIAAITVSAPTSIGQIGARPCENPGSQIARRKFFSISSV
jgi:hypothetical protein